jgi:hypothetical protein
MGQRLRVSPSRILRTTSFRRQGKGQKQSPFLANTQQPSPLSARGFGLNRQTHASCGVKPGYAGGAVACGSLAFAGASTV